MKLFRFYFVILSRKPEIRPHERPTELVMHTDPVGENEREGRVMWPPSPIPSLWFPFASRLHPPVIVPNPCRG